MKIQARAIAKGQKVTSPDFRLVLFLKCQDFHCLPNKGGLFDQDPELLDAFEIISGEIEKVKMESYRKEQADMRQSKMRRH